MAVARHNMLSRSAAGGRWVGGQQTNPEQVAKVKRHHGAPPLLICFRIRRRNRTLELLGPEESVPAVHV